MIDGNKSFERLGKQLGSSFAATMYIAQEARRRRASLNYYVLDSQVISWVVSGSKPKPLPKISKRRNYRNSPIYDKLELVDDIEVREAVIASIRLSLTNYLSSTTFHKNCNIPEEMSPTFMNNFLSNNRLSDEWISFDYDNVIDESRRSRVRILTRMIWDSYL